jgi:hypothetical protein
MELSYLFEQDFDRLLISIEVDRTGFTPGIGRIFHGNVTWRVRVIKDLTFCGLFAIKNIPARCGFKKSF